MAVQVTVLSIDDEQLSAPKKSVFTKADISIGRSRLNDLVLEHPGVSNTHARVRIEGVNGSTRFYVSDLDSTNGTMVGNKRLDPRAETVLSDKDRIMIAGFILKIDSVPEDLIFSTDPEPELNVADKPDFAEGKVTNTFDIFRKPRIEDEAPLAEVKEIEEMPNQTIWNSNLLGAYREERVKADPVSEPEPLVSEAPKKPTEVDPISWPVAKEEPKKEIMETAPEFVAETKLVLDDHLTVDFVATRLLSIGGKVLRKGMPVAGVKVSDKEFGVTETNAQGEFSFSDVADGAEYNFSLEKPGHVLIPATLSGSVDNEDLSLEVEAKRLLSITGSITHKGAGLADVVVDGGKLGIVKTDNMGLYKFDDALEGEEYILKASKSGYSFGALKRSA